MPTPTKVPGLPAVPSNLESDLKAYLEALGEALEIRLGRRGDDLDRAVTLRELTEAGLVTTIKAQPFDPNRDITKDTVGVSPVGGLVVTVPPPPSNFVASGAFKNVVLTWTDPRFLYGNHAHTEVFRQDAQAADPDGIALNQTLSGSGNLTLNGILMTQDATNGTSINSSVQFNVPTTITITSAGNDSGRTFTVTGTNTSDGAQTEDITGANAGTATGSSIFKTVTQIAINGASAGNVSAGPAQSVDSIGSATQILIANAMTITDSSVQAGKAYFYWVRFINTSGIGGPFNSTNGTIASTVRIQEADISEDAITTPKLKAGSITADQAQLATASVVTANIADANITTAKIADADVETLKIKGEAVTIPVAAFTAGTNTNTTLQSVSFTVPSDTGISGFTMDIVLTFSCQPFCISDDGSNSALISFQRSGSNLTLTGANDFGYRNDPYEESGTAGSTQKMPPISVSVLDENVSPGTYTYSVIHSGSFGVNFKFESRLLLALGVKR